MYAKFQVVDPTHQEEAVMAGRMTATLNTNGDICAIQKAGGEGVPQSVIMHCLRIAATKAADITVKIRDTVSLSFFSVYELLRLVSAFFVQIHAFILQTLSS